MLVLILIDIFRSAKTEPSLNHCLFWIRKNNVYNSECNEENLCQGRDTWFIYRICSTNSQSCTRLCHYDFNLWVWKVLLCKIQQRTWNSTWIVNWLTGNSSANLRNPVNDESIFLDLIFWPIYCFIKVIYK